MIVITIVFVVISALTVTAYVQIAGIQDDAHAAAERGEISIHDSIFVARAKIKRVLTIVAVLETVLISTFFIWSLRSMIGLKKIGERDALTGIYNRVRFRDLRHRYTQNPPGRLGIVFFDIDGLKKMNDTMGHDDGDVLICTVADCIRHEFGDDVCRIGGDEFVVVDTDSTEVELAEKLQRTLALMDEKKVSVSYGSVWKGENCDFVSQLHEADEQMYSRKRAKYDLAE